MMLHHAYTALTTPRHFLLISLNMGIRELSINKWQNQASKWHYLFEKATLIFSCKWVVTCITPTLYCTDEIGFLTKQIEYNGTLKLVHVCQMSTDLSAYSQWKNNDSTIIDSLLNQLFLDLFIASLCNHFYVNL